MKVYLDTSVYNRPFDDQTQPKIFLETQATILILQMVEIQTIELVSSLVLEYENSRNSNQIRQQTMTRYLAMATQRQFVTPNIKARGEELEQQGLKALDALHIACAEVTESDYFLTCDKRLINRCQDLDIKVLNPVNFILEIEEND